jgi:hypothetical protein
MSDTGRLDPREETILDEERERLAGFRWFTPDGEMETLTASALQWIDDRVDEHVAALRVFETDELRLPEVTVRVTRSMDDACALWESSWTERDTGIRRIAKPPFARVLERAAHAATERVARDHDMTSVLFPAMQLDRFARELVERSPTWRALLAQRLWEDRIPGFAAVVLHLDWRMAFDDDPERPSPWAPLVALWERGLWPIALPDGVVLVYVPVLRGGVIVPEPQRADDAPVPRRPVRSATATRALPTWCELGYGPPPGQLDIPREFRAFHQERIVMGVGVVRTPHSFRAVIKLDRDDGDEHDDAEP